MIDYLIGFPDKDTAIAFGVAGGYTTVDESGEATTTFGTHDFYIDIIGKNYVETGEVKDSPFGDLPVKELDGKHWILFRDMNGTIEIPNGLGQYIAWQSDSGEDIPATAPNRRFA
jgi:hypothetical protein|tara:strand:- start:2 stop:346 length:345 start_codon:yes stop_codon:yes gene_type:complete